MVDPNGIEPSTSCVQNRRSPSWAKDPHVKLFNYLVPKAGIEPARYCYHGILSPARLPIPPLRQEPMVSPKRFERSTHWLKVSCSTDWATETSNGADCRNWTRNLLITSQLLCQIELSRQKWWRSTGSNRWPSACKADALPTELDLHMLFII